MREPWFQILEVREARGRSMADIAKSVAEQFGLTVTDLRSERRSKVILRARMEALRAIRDERRDLTSAQVSRFFNKESSTIRYHWRAA